MNASSTYVPGPAEVIRILAAYWRRWLVPAAAVGIAAAAYAFTAPATWQASQALIVRNEAANNDAAPGKFARTEDVKAVQETIVELVKSRGLLAAALKEVGPPADCADKGAWPTERDIVALRKQLRLVPPKGGEFGATEVFYLEVRDGDRVRVVALNDAICRHLQTHFQQLRDAKAQSMIDEMTRTVALARSDLNESLAKLNQIEREVGGDLIELRMLHESPSGDSSLRRTVTEIENELRQARNAENSDRQLLGLLHAAGADQGRLLASPNRLLEAQPGLRRLKEGLVDAQLRSAALEGRMSVAHPLVVAAKQAEEEIGRQLHAELAIATRGVEAELEVNSQRVAMLDKQLAAASVRLNRLAGLRTAYSEQVAESTNRMKLVERAEQNLAEARATHAGANAANLIARIDAPDAGCDPVSASRGLIVVAGICGGLLFGFGIVFLTAQPLRSAAVAAAAPARSAAAERPAPRSAAPAAPAPLPRTLPPVYAPPPLVFPAGVNLSLNEALQRIASGSAA